MIYKKLLTFLSLGLVCAGMSNAASARDADPLFADDSILEVRLVAPLKQIMKERTIDEELPGTFEMVTADGSSLQVPVQIRTRGNYRRRKNICQFAPLRFNFKKSDVSDTLLDKQDKVKLVTHCKKRSKVYEQAVIKEYLVYRMLNIITDISFRARLLRITYVDSDDDNSETTTFAFLIENKGRLAKRLEMESMDVESVQMHELDREYTNLGSVYQYLIGNLDFSPVRGSEGKSCCHNFALFLDNNEKHWSIPYDFDMTGFVEPPHLKPNPTYKQRDVRQRVYRGRCYNQKHLPSTLQQFRDKRADIEALIADQPGMDKSSRKRVSSYVEDFYKLLDKEDKLLKKFADTCI